jgi:tetratricopeptide (TPR) repeat protein
MTALTQDGRQLTTSGSIAVVNLNAQIDGLTARLLGARSTWAPMALTAADMTPLVDLLLLRGQVLGRIADYERAAGLAEALVRDAPDDGAAWLARARTQSTLHRFARALADLDAAERRGADPAALDTERAAILQAVGRCAEALMLRRTAVERRPDFATLGALAVLEAERGQVTEAESLFTEARRRYRGVSPFPIADLDFRRGLMWHGRGDLRTAHDWFDAAVRRVPDHAPALGHLAEIASALGAHGPAIDRLRPLTVSSDDPDYAATLAAVLLSAGQPQEAEQWRVTAAARYDELVARHPEAFAHHAAHFWLTVGGDRSRGLRLQELDRASRCATRGPTPIERAARED